MEQELMPGLPEDIARQCLIRVPYGHFRHVRSVCMQWKHELASPLFHETRKINNQTRPVIVLVQAEPALSSTGPAHKYYNSAATPTYRLSVYNPVSATWQCLPGIPGLDLGLPLFCQISSVGKDLVVVGGWDPESWALSDGVYVYNFVTGSWRLGQRMPGPRRSFFACSGSDSGSSSGSGLVFVAGGHDEEKNALKSALAYDVARDVWVPLADMEKERDECKGFFLGGKFHVVGGYCTERQGRFGRSGESFHVETWRWGPVEEEWLESDTCPRTCVVGGDGRVYMCRNGHVAVKDEGSWRTVAELPEDATVAPQLVAWNDGILLMGSGSHGGTQEGYVLALGESKWRRVAVPPEFSGHVQAGCCLEI